MRRVLHAHYDADLKGFVNPFENTLACHVEGERDLAHGLAGIITPHDLSPLDVAEGQDVRKIVEI